jgi:hypothetical protein
MHILGLWTDQVIDLADVRLWIGKPRGEQTCNVFHCDRPRRIVVCLCGASGRMSSEDSRLSANRTVECSNDLIGSVRLL